MTCLIHYTTEKGNQVYTLTAYSKEEADNKLKQFLEHNNLHKDEITLEMISAN